ncbi:MAG: putative GTP cyclohydrolase [Peltula sp. TS41687]|nr:MAG: putative GTP cyclohydrolase [Peltula sp. TS41687]
MDSVDRSGRNWEDTLAGLLAVMNTFQAEQEKLVSSVEDLKTGVDLLTRNSNMQPLENGTGGADTPSNDASSSISQKNDRMPAERSPQSSPSLGTLRRDIEESRGVSPAPSSRKQRAGQISRVILTTYPGQIGIDPIPMNWGHKDPKTRGPVVVTRTKGTIGRRNAIGAHGGSYAIYHALAVASNELDVDHRPDFTDTEPAVDIGPFPQWADPKKIVSMDPFGHEAPRIYKDMIAQENVDIRPTIAVTKAHMKLPELEESVRSGRLVPDGKICLNKSGELAVTKFAVEPVWYLPGVAERFGIDEGALRRSLFENTGGSYPELITRSDIKLFLPPIGGLTVYCFGDPAKMSDPNVRLSLRVHDECNGSDVFGSDICTCRPYLIFGVEEAVKEAQNGGSGVVIYFRKEGRALGEVTKYLVYNARKRSSDRASEYFKRTENVAGVKDMRFQSLMPDILHWLGISKIDRMLSMSNMKHDAIVAQGIPIHERVPIPDDLIPADSRVEIDAKIHAGYFTNGKVPNMVELSNIQGRAWDDVDH